MIVTDLSSHSIHCKEALGPVGYSLVADPNHAVCKAYDVETPDGKVAYRGSLSYR